MRYVLGLTAACGLLLTSASAIAQPWGGYYRQPQYGWNGGDAGWWAGEACSGARGASA